MTEKDLFREIGMIDEKYVEEANELKKAKILTPVFKRSLATVACLCICVGVYFATRDVREESNKGFEMNDASGTSEESQQFDGAASDKMEATADAIESVLEDFFEDSMKAESSTTIEGESAVDDKLNHVGTENIQEENPALDDEMSSESYEAVTERLAGYPDDYEEICATDAFVVVHGVVKNGTEEWEAFLSALTIGKAASVDVVCFTEEGDPIISYVYYDGECYYVVEDSTRDEWGNGSVWQGSFRYMNFMEKDGVVEIVFSDEIISGDAFENDKEVDMHHLVQYKIAE